MNNLKQQFVFMVVAVTVVLAPVAAAAQAPAVSTARTAWGDPDLGGIFDYSSITPMQRPADLGDREYLTEEEAAALEQGAVNRDIAKPRLRSRNRSRATRPAPTAIRGSGGLISVPRWSRTGERRGSSTLRTAVFRP
jgi:hypothetical protein